MQAGIFLRSTELLQGTNFENALVFITEFDEKGAIGMVVNKRWPRFFNDLEEFSTSVAFPLYEGGPVDQEHLFFLHHHPELITGGKPVTGQIQLGGDFDEAVRLINNHTIHEKDIKLFIGYCGWDPGELEAEIAEGSWTIETGGSPFNYVSL